MALRLRVRSLMARIVAILDSASFIGPFYVIDPKYAPMHNKAKLSMLRTIVGMDDWIWETCGVGRGFEVGWFNYNVRLCEDKDNPLYYFQSELLIDEMDTGADDAGYYTAVTAAELAALRGSGRAGHFSHMEKWSPSSHSFWLEWVKQEIRANMDPLLVTNGLHSLEADTLVHWTKNSDGANTFAQNLLWYNRRHTDGRCAEGESFHVAYVSLHRTKTIRSVVLAVGVFIQDGGFYSTMGITKSFRVAMSNTREAEEMIVQIDDEQDSVLMMPAEWIDAYNGYNEMRGNAVKLQKFIAKQIKETIDSETKGLLFRPNGTMRDMMRESVRSMRVGTDVDWDRVNQIIRLGTHVQKTNAHLMNKPPLISQLHATIQIRGMAAKLEIPIPFWEKRYEYSHPDSPLNPHLPLVFIGIDELTEISDDGRHAKRRR